MKERPIILNTDTVNAFLDGRKTQYRNPVNKDFKVGSLNEITYYKNGVTDATNRYFRYPWGPVLDRVWVRESFRSAGIQYKSDGDKAGPTLENYRGGWESPVHMPRWASRLTMDIVAVRIELLQSISPEDCAEEGCDMFIFPEYWNRKTKDKTMHWASNPLVFVTTFKVI